MSMYGYVDMTSKTGCVDCEDEATASSACEKPSERRGGYDDIDEDSDVEESKYGYIDMVSAGDGKTRCVPCDDREERDIIGGSAKGRREDVLSYHDIDTFDDEEDVDHEIDNNEVCANNGA